MKEDHERAGPKCGIDPQKRAKKGVVLMKKWQNNQEKSKTIIP
jgi:hypothetical protein